MWPDKTRSYQCPPYSCWILVILVESGGIQWSKIWQEGLLIFSFRCILILVEFGHSGIETRTGLAGMECNWNLVVCLITVCLAIVCMTITFIHITKHGDNTLSSVVHFPPQTLIPKWETTLFLETCRPLWFCRSFVAQCWVYLNCSLEKGGREEGLYAGILVLILKLFYCN